MYGGKKIALSQDKMWCDEKPSKVSLRQMKQDKVLHIDPFLADTIKELRIHFASRRSGPLSQTQSEQLQNIEFNFYKAHNQIHVHIGPLNVRAHFEWLLPAH